MMNTTEMFEKSAADPDKLTSNVKYFRIKQIRDSRVQFIHHCCYRRLLSEDHRWLIKLTYSRPNHISIAPYSRNFRGAGHVCVLLVQGHWLAMRRPGVEPATCWSQVQHHYAIEPYSASVVYCTSTGHRFYSRPATLD